MARFTPAQYGGTSRTAERLGARHAIPTIVHKGSPLKHGQDAVPPAVRKKNKQHSKTFCPLCLCVRLVSGFARVKQRGSDAQIDEHSQDVGQRGHQRLLATAGSILSLRRMNGKVMPIKLPHHDQSH